MRQPSVYHHDTLKDFGLLKIYRKGNNSWNFPDGCSVGPLPLQSKNVEAHVSFFIFMTWPLKFSWTVATTMKWQPRAPWMLHVNSSLMRLLFSTSPHCLKHSLIKWPIGKTTIHLKWSRSCPQIVMVNSLSVYTCRVHNNMTRSTIWY